LEQDVKIRRFAAGFLITLITFGGLNLLAAHLRSDCGLPAVLGMARCADDIRRAGFPWVFWEEGGLAYRQIFSPGVLALDLSVVLAAAGLVGALANRWARAGGQAPRP
jgi:hypothetical protein